jgi:hypothetical protein
VAAAATAVRNGWCHRGPATHMKDATSANQWLAYGPAVPATSVMPHHPA